MANQLGKNKVMVRSSGLASRMNRGLAEDLTIFGATARAARQAYEWAGIGPADVNIVELHDAFSIGELLHYEGLELCARGESRQLVLEQATTIGGRVPVNPSGGLLARGHPVGATGVVQLVELALQLRGEAGTMQVDRPRVALAQCQGGTGAGAGAAVVSLLSV
jgi:acetyl-CoA acetyltransferase